MPKPVSLNLDEAEFKAPPAPLAAQSAKSAPVAEAKPVKAERVPVEPLQVRWPKEAIKAVKRDALEADQTVSDFLLACYHGSKKA